MVQQLLEKVEGGVSSVPKVSPHPELSSTDDDTSDWWDSYDLMEKLKISLSTVERRRKDGTFKSFRIGGRYWYLKDDILRLKDRFMK